MDSTCILPVELLFKIYLYVTDYDYFLVNLRSVNKFWNQIVHNINDWDNNCLNNKTLIALMKMTKVAPNMTFVKNHFIAM